jgi:hypothetical protein
MSRQRRPWAKPGDWCEVCDIIAALHGPVCLTCQGKGYLRGGVEPFKHPRVRSDAQWRADIAAARPEAAVVLDALTSGTFEKYPTLRERLRFLIRLAIEDRRRQPGTEMGNGKRFTRTWVFRWRLTQDQRRNPRGDVFCLFCHEPLLQNVPERPLNWVGRSVTKYIDYGRNVVVANHTPRCALIHLAGLRPYAAWGSVTYPDPDAEVA